MHKTIKEYPINVAIPNRDVQLPEGSSFIKVRVRAGGPVLLAWTEVADQGDPPVPTMEYRFRLRQTDDNMGQMRRVRYIDSFEWQGTMYHLGEYAYYKDDDNSGDIP